MKKRLALIVLLVVLVIPTTACSVFVFIFPTPTYGPDIPVPADTTPPVQPIRYCGGAHRMMAQAPEPTWPADTTTTIGGDYTTSTFPNYVC